MNMRICGGGGGKHRPRTPVYRTKKEHSIRFYLESSIPKKYKDRVEKLSEEDRYELKLAISVVRPSINGFKDIVSEKVNDVDPSELLEWLRPIKEATDKMLDFYKSSDLKAGFSDEHRTAFTDIMSEINEVRHREGHINQVFDLSSKDFGMGIEDYLYINTVVENKWPPGFFFGYLKECNISLTK